MDSMIKKIDLAKAIIEWAIDSPRAKARGN